MMTMFYDNGDNIEKEFNQIREESKEGIEVARGTPYNRG